MNEKEAKMKTATKNTLLLFFLFMATACNSQDQQRIKTDKKANKISVIGGPFENGEFMYIGMPEKITAVDTSAGWSQAGQKLLITGTIYKQDGKTPAANVILYYYHTDTDGYYSSKKGLDPRVVRHGYIRGWVKSDKAGKYSIYTVRPGPYPNTAIMAHIHSAIKEPGISKEYYLDGFVFDDDPILTSQKRKSMKNRGGSGILRLLQKGNLHIAEHNIILGLNIPNYPKASVKGLESGLEIGEDIFSFTPRHAWGSDKGTKACPVCKYGRHHGILFFVGNKPKWDEIERWLLFLEMEDLKRGKYLKAYFIYGNENDFDRQKRTTELEHLGKELNLTKVALTFVPSLADRASDIYLNEINPDVESTIIIYKNSTIIDKFIDLKATRENFDLISKTLEESSNEYFYLPGLAHD